MKAFRRVCRAPGASLSRHEVDEGVVSYVRSSKDKS